MQTQQWTLQLVCVKIWLDLRIYGEVHRGLMCSIIVRVC